MNNLCDRDTVLIVFVTEWLTAGGPYYQSVAEKNLVRRDWLLDFTCITWLIIHDVHVDFARNQLRWVEFIVKNNKDLFK